MAGRDLSADSLSNGAKLVIVLAILASGGFIIAAVVTFIREGDWPAKYLSIAATILLVLVIGLKRRSRRQRVK
jgi:hypothetical protein